MVRGGEDSSDEQTTKHRRPCRQVLLAENGEPIEYIMLIKRRKFKCGGHQTLKEIRRSIGCKQEWEKKGTFRPATGVREDAGHHPDVSVEKRARTRRGAELLQHRDRGSGGGWGE